MSKNQKGFSVVEVFIIVVILGLIGTVSWLVYDRQKSTSSKNTAKVSTTQNSEKAKEIAYSVPVGFTKYENKEFGFRFAYPTSWGELATQKDSTIGVLALQTPLTNMSSSDTVQLTLWVDKKENFKTYPNYKQPLYSPVAADDSYNWVYAESVYGSEKGANADLGDIAIPNKSDIHLFGIKSGHACGANQQWLFPVKDSFVGINVVYGNCYTLDENLTDVMKAEAEAAYKKVETDIQKISTTIEVDS